MRKILLALLQLSMLAGTLTAAEWSDSLRYRAEIGTTFSSGSHTPFWMASNDYAFSSLRPNNGWLRAGVFHDLDHSKKFAWGAGVDLGVAYRFDQVFIPQQIYAEVKYRCLNAMLGQKEFADEIVDRTLSMGGLTNSGNARPIPQLRIGIFDYADVWGCNGWFAIKGHIAYGMFTDNSWIKDWTAPQSEYTLNTLYCSRAIYFRGGDARQHPLVGELGLVMDTQFGGTTYSPVNADGVRIPHKNPTNFAAWIKGLIPLGGDATTPAGEQLNVQGNFLGNWAFALGWYDPAGWSVKAYYEHFFEDHSMLFFDYPWIDGLYGVQGKLPKNPYLSEAVIEFLYMKDQAGSVYYDHDAAIDYQISGRDGYYTNYIYNGWQNYGRTIGNPMLLSPLYNNPHYLDVLHNRISAWNVGLKGDPTQQVSWRLRASYLESLGTYSRPLRNRQRDASLLAQIHWHPGKLKGWEGSLSLAMDYGSLLGHNYGFGISISKTGFFGWK